MESIEKLAKHYRQYVEMPWRKDLAGAQRVIFVVYDPREERRLQRRKHLFQEAAEQAGHAWQECDLTRAFARWMGKTEYCNSYFEEPQDLNLLLEDAFPRHVAGLLRDAFRETQEDDNAVVAVFGIASLFSFLRVSKLLKSIEPHIRGRLTVFFPGAYDFENNAYRLLNARDDLNYLAVPISLT